MLILQGKDGILYSITTLHTNSFRWKDLKKALHLIFSEGESKHTLSRLAAQRICQTKFFKWPSNSGEYEILSSVNLGRKKYELRMWFWSANVGNRELRMLQKTLEICLSETHASGTREVQAKDLSSQAMLIPDEKATMEKEWKEVIKKAQKNKRWGKSTVLHWWTSATS